MLWRAINLPNQLRERHRDRAKAAKGRGRDQLGSARAWCGFDVGAKGAWSSVTLPSLCLTRQAVIDGKLSRVARQASIVLCALTLCTVVAREVDAQTDQEFAIWAAVFANAQLFDPAPSPVFWFDAHGRRGELGTVAILRPGVGYAFAPWVSLYAGYAWIPEWLDATGGRRDEHRIWEQLIFDYHGDQGIWVQSRTRFEQRFANFGTGTAHRFRQLVRLNYRPKASVPVGIAFWDEVFVGIQGASWAKQGFDQNRAHLGLAIYSSKPFRVEIGYLNVYASRQTNRMSHVLGAAFFVGFKGKKHPT
jgi:hypothetical protein